MKFASNKIYSIKPRVDLNCQTNNGKTPYTISSDEEIKTYIQKRIEVLKLLYRTSLLSNIFSVELSSNTKKEIIEYICSKRELYMRTLFDEKINYFSNVNFIFNN